MIIKHFGMVSQCCSSDGWQDAVKVGPQQFKDLTGDNPCPRNKSGAKLEEAIVFVGMDMEWINGFVNCQFQW